jgi:hypothetical protein
MTIDVCPICLEKKVLHRHHLWRRAIFGRGNRNNEVELICDICHQTLESEITRKENQILRQYPEIYAGTFNEFLAIGREGVNEYRKKLNLKRRK